MIDKHTHHKWSLMHTVNTYRDQVTHNHVYTQLYPHLGDIDTHNMCM